MKPLYRFNRPHSENFLTPRQGTYLEEWMALETVDKKGLLVNSDTLEIKTFASYQKARETLVEISKRRSA